MRIAMQIGGLFALWLLMSGIYQPLTIGFGFLSSVLCVWIIHKLKLVPAKGLIEEMLIFRGLRYLGWLAVEIFKADWAVTKVILSKDLHTQQRLIGVPANQKSDLAKTLFANSITLTPGTVTVETESEQLIIHALTDEAADLDALEQMGKNVSALERTSVSGGKK